MKLLDLVCALGCLALTCVSSPAAASETKHYADGGWEIMIRHDPFSGETSCALRSFDHRMTYQPHAIGFRLKHRDTLRAWYRVDDGSPVRWQDRYPALIASGVQLDGPALDDPTAGIVWLPDAEVARARTVAIRLSPVGPVRHFSIGGFSKMLEASRRLGCGSGSAFSG